MTTNKEFSSITGNEVLMYDESKIKNNLNLIVTSMNQHLQMMPAKHIFWIRDKQHPKGTFAIKKEDDANKTFYLPILSPLILNRIYDVFVFGYNEVKNITGLDWEMPDPKTKLSIPNFEEKYKMHKTTCEEAVDVNSYDLKYCMNYDIIVKIKINGQEVPIAADEKVCFIVTFVKW